MAATRDDFLRQYGSATILRLRQEREQALALGERERADRVSAEIVDHLEQGNREHIADSRLRTNEQLKYTATFLNGIATVILSAGVATPVLGTFAPGSPYTGSAVLLGEVSAGCTLVAVVIHTAVRGMLKGLKA